jgi:pimeloyl-ACP methyl ester carboxylesterase
LKKTIYIFSGLGADERIFKNLDFSNFNTIHIKWERVTKDESIEEYAKKTIQNQIHEPNPILLGVSFGGMLAIEVSKQIPFDKIVIISSIKIANELPFYLKGIGRTSLNKTIPDFFLRYTNTFVYHLFGTKTKEEKLLLKNIMHETDEKFLRWAIGKVLNWKNKVIPKGLIHIHGDKDKLFPINYIQEKITVKGGGHFMVFTKAKEISALLNQHLS